MRTRRTQLLPTTTKKTHKRRRKIVNKVKIEESQVGSLFNDGDMNNITIKQEDIDIKIEKNTSFNNDIIEKSQPVPIKLENSATEIKELYCKLCQLDFSSLKVYYTHMKQLHKLDPHHPDSYCQPCNTMYTRRYGLWAHLRGAHKMFIPKYAKKKSTIEPDLSDPNFYYQSCDYKFPSRGRYRIHLQRQHNFNIPPHLTDFSQCTKYGSEDYIFHCQYCDLKFVTVGLYSVHLRSVHKKKIPYIIVPLRPKYPIQLNPNAYCKSFNTKTYIQHISLKKKRKTFFAATIATKNIQ